MKKILMVSLWVLSATPALAQPALVPASFVGCPADGQTGPEAAPASAAIPQLPPAAAQALAYYAGPDLGVLAPRGWHCAETYGSDGNNLLVTPQPLTPGELISAPPYIATGPAVQTSISMGDTSGRFEVAEIADRIFPAAHAFVASVQAENLAPPTIS